MKIIWKWNNRKWYIESEENENQWRRKKWYEKKEIIMWKKIMKEIIIMKIIMKM